MNIPSKLEPFERCFGHQLSCMIFMSVGLGLTKLRNCGLNLSSKSLWKDTFELNVNYRA